MEGISSRFVERAVGYGDVSAPPTLAAMAKSGARTRKLRKQRELSQEVMAARIGISQKYLSELERGQKSPSWDTLVDIAHKGFEIKLASLMFGIDEDAGAEA